MQEEKQLQSQRMGTMPEGKLLISMAVPMMLSMIVQALYNIIDSMYVARVSEDCLTALSLAFPAQNIMIGLATGTGVGVSTMISRALGAGRPKRAGKVAGNAVFLCFVYGILLALFGFFGVKAFVHSQISSTAIRAHADSYLRIVSFGSIFMFFEITFQRFLQSSGQMKPAMWAQITGAVSNIILDPFFIFGWCGLPALGTAGAAIATIISQAFGALIGLFFHCKYNREVRFTLADIRPDRKVIGDIYQIGFPSIVMMAVGSLTNYVMNRILSTFTSTAVAVYGAYFKLQSFFFMPVFGLNNAFTPIVGFNYGAGKKERIYRTYRLAILYALVAMCFGLLVMQLFPGTLLKLFSASDHMLSIGIPALRTISWHFPVAAFCIVSLTLCQALGKSFFSLFASLMRQVIGLLPAAYLFSLTGDVNNIWWCFLVAESFSALATLFFRAKALKDMEKKLSGGAEA